jgi:hypothetical protein
MVRDSMLMQIVYPGPGGINYLFSADGGLTWDTPVVTGPSGQPFIAYTGWVLHVIFANSGHINYTRNPPGNGNCPTVGIPASGNDKSNLTIYPNPFNTQTTIDFNNEYKHAAIRITDIPGKEIMTKHFEGTRITIEKGEMQAGIYFLQITDENKNTVNRKIIIQ